MMTVITMTGSSYFLNKIKWGHADYDDNDNDDYDDGHHDHHHQSNDTILVAVIVPPQRNQVGPEV